MSHFRALVLLVIAALIFSHFANAQGKRVTVAGKFGAGPNYNMKPATSSSLGQTYTPQDGTKRPLEGPHFAFEVKFVHQAWILAGSPVMSCEVEWTFLNEVGQPDEEYIVLRNFDQLIDLSDPYVQEIIKADPNLELGQYAGNATTLKIRQDALNWQPKLYNLEFVVPFTTGRELSAYAADTGRDPNEVVSISGSQGLRCATGATGAAGQPGLNTPYSFDLSELVIEQTESFAKPADAPAILSGIRVGAYVPEDDVRLLYSTVVNRFGTTDGSVTQEARGGDIVLTNADFNLQSVHLYLSAMLREAAERARADELALIEHKRQQDAEAGRATRADVLQEERQRELEALVRYQEPKRGTEGFDEILARFEQKFEQELVIREAALVPPSERADQQEYTLVIEGPVSDEDLARAADKSTSLSEALARFETEMNRLGESPDDIDLSAYAGRVPKDPMTELLSAARMNYNYGTQEIRTCVQGCEIVLCSGGPNCQKPKRYEMVPFFYNDSALNFDIDRESFGGCVLAHQPSRAGDFENVYLQDDLFNDDGTPKPVLTPRRYGKLYCESYSSELVDLWELGFTPLPREYCRQNPQQSECSQINRMD